MLYPLLGLLGRNEYSAKFSIRLEGRDGGDMVESKGLFSLLQLDDKPLSFVGSCLRGDGFTLALGAINKLNFELITTQTSEFEIVVVGAGDHFII